MASADSISMAATSEWLVASLRCGVVAVDSAGTVTSLNAEAERILGVSPLGAGSVCGLRVEEVLAARPGVVRLLRDALAGREPPARAELTLAARDTEESRTTIGFTATAVRDAGGRIRGAALLFRDLTPIERADERERQRDRLAALGQMAAGLAHEIRNPLAGMEILVGLLKRRLAGRPEELSLLEDLSAEIRTLERGVAESLEIVRPVRLAAEPVDLEAGVERALAQVLARVAFRGQVARRIEPDLPRCHGDPDQLHSLFTNLIGNAVEAMEGPGSARPGRLVLEIGEQARPGSADEEPGSDRRRELVVTIQDDGPGIPERHRERVFHPFFTTKATGSGVGLAAAQKIVASHGGCLELESRCLESADATGETGTRFRIRLPVATVKEVA